MEDDFAKAFAGACNRVLLFYLIFFVGAVSFAIDAYYVSHVAAPGAVASYGFAFLFGMVFVSIPVLSYVMTRYLKRNPAVVVCPLCRKALWWNTLVCLQTAVLKRCPNCWTSLIAHRGFPVDTARDQAATSKREDQNN